MAKYLKLFMVALFATMTFTLTSCGDDDEPDDPTVNSIVGTWKENSDHYVRFGAGGAYTEVNIYAEDDIDILKGKWELDGSKLKINANDDDEYSIVIPVESTVKSVTNSELILETWGISQKYKKVSDSEMDKYL